MQVHIDRPSCQAYGNCADEAPEVFELDDQGYVQLVGGEDVPDALEQAARAAILSCPARALSASE
ncbi:MULTISPECIES: ferredoxin [unclassified Nocardioides]|uniref:ferredoxin n=1 Tax=unclassified Nocardioides TaxID=2615069 RepID=UPI0002FDFF57|nr:MULTISPECIES: ferredoxin [unclassified Nocardioides]